MRQKSPQPCRSECVCVWWIGGWGERGERINPPVMILILFAIIFKSIILLLQFLVFLRCNIIKVLKNNSRLSTCIQLSRIITLFFFKVIIMFLLNFNNNKKGFLKGVGNSTQYDHQRYAYGFLPIRT